MSMAYGCAWTFPTPVNNDIAIALHFAFTPALPTFQLQLAKPTSAALEQW